MREIKITYAKKLKPGATRIFSQTTLARFEEIAELIKAHESNIAYLQFVAGCRNTLRRMGCKKIIPALQSTSEDEARLPRTLDNLQKQIDLLNYEREVLKKYGR
jgi:hypothetical protein